MKDLLFQRIRLKTDGKTGTIEIIEPNHPEPVYHIVMDEHDYPVRLHRCDFDVIHRPTSLKEATRGLQAILDEDESESWIDNLTDAMRVLQRCRRLFVTAYMWTSGSEVPEVQSWRDEVEELIWVGRR